MFRCMVVRSWHELLGGDIQFSGQVRGSRDVTRAWFGMLWHLQFGQRFLAFTLRHPCAHVAHPLPVIGTGHFRQVFDVIWRNIHAFALLLNVHAHAAFRILVSRCRVCTHACAGTASARQTCASSFSASYKACTCVACKHKRTRKRARAHAVCTLSAHTWPANLRHEESLDLLQLADTQYLPLPAPDAFRTQHKPRQDGYYYRCQHQMPSAPNTSRARTATIGPRPEGCGQGACTGHPSKQASGNSTANGTRGAVTTSNRAAARNGAS